MNIIVTGGAGFIGSALIRYLIQRTEHHVLNIDKLTYASNLSSLDSVKDDPRYRFIQADICDQQIAELINEFRPNLIMNLAAESHVDRSIDSAAPFIQTNIVGTFNLLEASRRYFMTLDSERKKLFRFHHISTDEVYGDLDGTSDLFTELTPYHPSSPYAASKASSDHLVRAWHRTYGLPVIITNCSNNYGDYQFPEKLIPLMILNAYEGKLLPVYGQGKQIRDWLHVDDHVEALYQVATQGKIGDTYNIGGHNEIMNIDVVDQICALMDELAPKDYLHKQLITYVTDRPGHDHRYAIDASKIAQDIGWTPKQTFATGLAKTVNWYLDNLDWCQGIAQGAYDRERLGQLEIVQLKTTQSGHTIK